MNMKEVETLPSCGHQHRVVHSGRKKEEELLPYLSRQWRCWFFVGFFFLQLKTGSLNSDVSSAPPRWPHMRRELSHLLEVRS